MTLEQFWLHLLDPQAWSITDPQTWVIAGAVIYYCYGFVSVRHIFRHDEDRVGATPFDRFAHLLLFVAPMAVIWPIPWLNWICRESEAAAIRREKRVAELAERRATSQ